MDQLLSRNQWLLGRITDVYLDRHQREVDNNISQ